MKSQQVCLHYAKQLEVDNLIQIIECKALVSSNEEARALSRFLRQMLEASAGDRDNGIEVLGKTALQYWMERIMNIISGYLYKIGYDEAWDKVSDEF